MTIQLVIYNVICVSFFLLALVSFFNPTKLNITANRWFGLFMFSAGCMVLNAIIYKAGAEAQYTHLIIFNELSRFIIAPALYLSILHFTSPDKVLKRREYLHFIPFGLFAGYITALNTGHQFFHLPAMVERVLALLMAVAVQAQLLIYWVLAWAKLNRHQKNIRLINSNTEAVDLNWLRYLLIGIAVIIVTWFAAQMLQMHWVTAVTAGLYLAGTLFMGYFLLAQKEVYPFDEPELEEIAEVIKPESKPLKKRLTPEQSAQLKTQLEHLMQTEKVYLDNELSLPQLAKEMGISTHDLSYLLNDVIGISFFQFVNTYRVEEAKQLMLSEKHRHLNLLGIAFSAGFNSKTTFNTAFKKETGLSPSEFMRGKGSLSIDVSVQA
ncbi:AraC family transcriptional regulator [Mucilaginibacter sp.]|uniref:helix-turn-helix domain-containing protein n=1 Tax=Mucilaginibacter sp. TaxID=1882438 RepID=UPI00261E30B3|nr:helix-turn-helix domain-containing protein [Mucilaginibacter sp.]